MADNFLKIPMGIVENLVVQLRIFIIPTYFVVLEMDNASEILLIIWWLFLDMTQVNINIANVTMTLAVERKK